MLRISNKKNILIIGCSYSQGSYAKIEPGSKRGSKENNIDYAVNTNGWFYYVDKIKNENYKIISFGGQGYWSYYQFVDYVNSTKPTFFNKFDEIWLQETREPRLVIHNWKKFANLINNNVFNNSNENIVYVPREPSLHFLTTNKNFLPFVVWNKPFYPVLRFFADFICDYFKNKNKKVYVWSMAEPIMQHEYAIKIADNVRDILLEKHLLTTSTHKGAHQTIDGNKFIGNLINEKLRNYTTN